MLFIPSSHIAVLHTILFHRIFHIQNVRETSILGINYVGMFLVLILLIYFIGL